jgi:hypothetical protein
MNNRIEKGDSVRVTFANDGWSLLGVVDYTPQATGDSWVIIQDDGTVNYVQMFEMMQLVSKHNAGITGRKERSE